MNLNTIMDLFYLLTMQDIAGTPYAKAICQFWQRTGRERGQGTIEYAFIIALVAVAVFLVLLLFGNAISQFYSTLIHLP